MQLRTLFHGPHTFTVIRMLKPVLRTGMLALMLLIPTHMLSAQNATTSGQIRGRVTDPSGAAVAGAAVIGRNTATGLERSAVSDGSGSYTLRALPPGTYRVRIEMLGFRADEQPAVRVTIGQTSTVNFQLQTAAVALAAVEVSGARAPVDVTDASVIQTVGREEIEELPVLGRDFTDFIALSGVVAPDPSVTTGGQFSIAGQRGSQTNLQIDGVDANNSFFGENRGGSRIPFTFSLESIQEFQVIPNGYDVEYGNYTGGVVNVVTRGGTNNLEGSLYGNYRSDALTGKGFLDTLKVKDYSVAQYSGRLSGPIKRDKAFYFFSLDGQRRREPQLPRGLHTYADTSAASAQARTELERFYTILETKYGIQDAKSGYESFQTSNDVLTLFGRIDLNLTDKHRLSFRHNYATYNNENEFAPGFDAPFGMSKAERLQSDTHSFTSELSSILSQSTFNVLRFQLASDKRPRQGNDVRPALVARLSNGDQIGYGGTFVSYNNNLEETKFQLIDNFTHARGPHTFKLGGNAMLTHELNAFLQTVAGTCGGSQGAGVFCFADLNALEAGTPSSYTFNVQKGGGMPISEFDVLGWALYAQDEWRMTPKLTVTGGLRYDRFSVLDDPRRVLDVERAFGLKTGTAPEDNNNVSPRISVAYDVGGDGRSVVRFGAGYMYGVFPNVLAGNVMGSSRPLLNLLCNGSLAKGDANAPPNPLDYSSWGKNGLDNPTTCGSTAQLQGVPTYTLWQDDFEIPESLKANLGYERLFGTSTKVSLDALYTRSTKLYTVRNLNLRAPVFENANEGGRLMFGPAATFDPVNTGNPNIANARVYSDLGDIYVNYNDGRAESWVTTLEANHRFTRSTTARASYTWTRSYDNSSYSCCTASSGFSSPIVGKYGPNDVGTFGDVDKAWGPSSFVREHTIVLSGSTRAPFGFGVSAIWRINSGRPWTPAISGDLNGDGVNFNDRPFIYASDDLPLSSTLRAGQADTIRMNYQAQLDDNSCIGDYVGKIIPRNTCRTPWTNSLDMRLSKGFNTVRGQRAELQIEFFNVMNGIGRLNCDQKEFNATIKRGSSDLPGWCGLGRRTTVSGANQNIYVPSSFTTSTNKIVYTPSANFGRETVLGDNLVLQFQTQIGLRYTF
jgi:hypothetical protein